MTTFVASVPAMTQTISPAVEAFFDRYRSALLDRDAEAIADLYAVPALILFPGRSVAVSDRSQTSSFFASAWSQYDGIDAADHDALILAETRHSVWVDVGWRYDGQLQERFCYQLINSGDDYQIAVLTPIPVDPEDDGKQQ